MKGNVVEIPRRDISENDLRAVHGLDTRINYMANKEKIDILKKAYELYKRNKIK